MKNPFRYFNSSPGLNDDEISRQLSIEPRQTVNQICRRLAACGVLGRTTGGAGKIINTLVNVSALPERPSVQPPAPVRLPAQGTGKALTPESFEKILLVIPCSKAKVSGGTSAKSDASLTEMLPPALAAQLQEARRNITQRIRIDESALMPAWCRYDGTLYRTARDALGDLLREGMHIIILSGGYGAVLADEPIGYYNVALRPSWWPNKLLPRILLAYANTHGITSVRGFASVTSPYFRVLNAIRWSEAGITDALLLAPEAQPGGTCKSLASLGEALTALRNRDLRAGWVSSYGLHLDIYGD